MRLRKVYYVCLVKKKIPRNSSWESPKQVNVVNTINPKEFENEVNKEVIESFLVVEEDSILSSRIV